MEEEKEIFYVGIKDPRELRRALLESTKDVVVFLKTYDNLKSLRLRKFDETAKLRLILEELSRLVAKLQRELPKTRLRLKPEELPKGKAKSAKQKKAVKVPASEVKKLEMELQDIEEKLKSLG